MDAAISILKRMNIDETKNHTRGGHDRVEFRGGVPCINAKALDEIFEVTRLGADMRRNGCLAQRFVLADKAVVVAQSETNEARIADHKWLQMQSSAGSARAAAGRA